MALVDIQTRDFSYRPITFPTQAPNNIAVVVPMQSTGESSQYRVAHVKIDGMTCHSCVKNIEETIGA